LTPIAAATIAGVMFAAVVSVHWSKGFFAQNGGFEFPLALAAAALGVAFAGPGKASLDNAFGWHLDGVGWGVVAVVIGAVGAAVVDLSRVWQLHHPHGAHPAST
jgi:putative oxidoreductase